MPIFNYVSSPFLCVVIHLQHRMAIQDKSSGIAGCVRGALLNYFGFVQGTKIKCILRSSFQNAQEHRPKRVLIVCKFKPIKL